MNILNSAYSTLLATIKEDLALSYTSSGALMSSYFIGYTVGQIPWGYLADRKGSRRTITVSILGLASSTVLFGLTSEIWQAIVFRFLAGLLGAGIFVPGVKLISSWFSTQERGTALGLQSVGGSIGLITASWMAPIIAIPLGWRNAIMIVGFMGVLLSTVVWLALRDREATESSMENNKKTDTMLSSRSFWILALTQFLRLGSNYAFIAWLPLLLHEEYGLSLLSASVGLSLFNVAGMLSNPLGGFVSDRVGEKRTILLSFLILAVNLYIFIYSNFLLTTYIAVFILGWFVNFVRSPSFAIVPKLYGVDVAGKISGIHNTFASMGALTIPLLLGYIRDVTDSYNQGWIALSTLLILGALVNIFLGKEKKSKSET